MRDDCDPIAVGNILIWEESAPKECLDAEEWKKISGDFAALDSLGALAAGDVDGASGKCRHVGKGRGGFFPIEKIGPGKNFAVSKKIWAVGRPRDLFFDLHQLPWIAIGQGPQEDGVDQAEDRRVDADAERERDNRQSRDCGTFLERAQSKAHILPEGIHTIV